MKREFEINEAIKLFEQIPEVTETRFQEISAMSAPFINITNRYGCLISRLTYLLGHIAPKDIQDAVIRDLMADVFDFLYDSRRLILSGNFTVAYPLARRAYESLSLLHLCALEPSWAEKWSSGFEIGNRMIRKALSKYPMGETEQQTKDLYSFFCKATHPNRNFVAHRFLGDGNEFVLGVIGKPNLEFVVDYSIKLLELWFWLTSVVSYFYRDQIELHDTEYLEEYHQAAIEAKQVKIWLFSNGQRIHGNAND